MLVEITCPECAKLSVFEYAKLPPKTLKTTCNTCGKQIQLNKTNRLNCKVVDGPQGMQAKIYKEAGWKVRHQICQGLEYDLEKVGGLVRSGLITETTKVLPPDAEQLVEAGFIYQLKKYFDQVDHKAN